jgi:hypothetical protein
MLQIPDLFAQPIVPSLEVLGDIADRLLRGCRPIFIPSRRNGVKRGNEAAAVEVREMHELQDDAVRYRPRRG